MDDGCQVIAKGLYRMLEPPRHVKAMSNVGVGPAFPLIEKNKCFIL